MLQLKEIRKAYGKNVVLEGINLSLANGIYGFLGANGVGKTTLFKIISGYIADYTGDVVYPQHNENKENLMGFLPQNFSGYPEMTISQFLIYMGTIKAKISENEVEQDVKEKMDLFNLTDIKDKKLKVLSGGQLRRVGLAQAFQLNPHIVLLDEPTLGLDPSERIKFKNYISSAGHKQIILISTHIVSDLEAICNEIYILKNRYFVMNGTEESLLNKCKGCVWEAEFENEEQLRQFIGIDTVSSLYDYKNNIKARIISTVSPVPNAVSVKPTLEDVYMMNFKKGGYV